MMSESEAVAALDAIGASDEIAGDTETAHAEADKVLLAAVPAAVAEAYQRVVDEHGGFWYA